MGKILIFVFGLTLSGLVFSGNIADASNVGNNCEKIAGLIADELSRSGDRLSKKTAISRVKMWIDNVDSFHEKYYRISADAVYDLLAGVEALSERWQNRKPMSVRQAGMLCKVEYLESTL
ncbi:MAG: hypothetical protein DIZ80_13120 [endosymbiont of Galathealinum brachiosum]|uniref:Uncharacterized protein n=1 Tax=endosymbiont of Galathealinum brachiosum TaxID=2200906 RepID=A0A370DA52_9GAMM|nr:MAG: hypothetical protein DIZ80_13120 [endosymbiont of Galathealinum brachiosum]